ncbi:porin family protein [Mucilaginibacter ximonensis]|uniref:Porin family protein n=1 Tax=Mucilaginibacter ximonensis TaxID=538021 RepID=A0ABW5YH53_9SPHI
MKTFLLSCILACSAILFHINHSYAQNAKVHLGIKSGADIMSFATTKSGSHGPGDTYGYRAGFQGGIYGIIHLDSKFEFIPQLLYTQKGATLSYPVYLSPTQIANVNLKIRYNYLDVPLLIGYKPLAGLTFMAGPQVAFLLSQKTEGTLAGGGGNQNISYTTTNGYRKQVIGGNLGVGYSFFKNIGINLHYTFDFQHAEQGSIDNEEKSAGFALSASYLF